MKEIQAILDRMEPEEALAELAPTLRKFLGHLDDEKRVQYISGLVGDQAEDKISSMVSL